MSIEAKSKKIMKDNIVRLAKEYSMPTTNVQLVMQFKEGQPKFYSAKDFVKDRELGVKELYPVLVDIFNVRDMIPVFIGNLLVDILKECDAEKEDDVVVYISTNCDKASKLYLHSYFKNKPHRQLTWSEVFGEEAMMKLMAKQS